MQRFQITAAHMTFSFLTWTRWWKIIPRDHPARTFIEGGREEIGASLKPCLWARASILALLVIAWMLLDALAHTLELNPLESVFDVLRAMT